MKKANYHELAEVPADLTRGIWEGEGGNRKLVNEADPYKWSGDNDPPKIGDNVKIYMNRFGTGTVTGYFAEYGWFGVLVKLDKPPAWWVKQIKQNGGNPDRAKCHFFGIDLEPRQFDVSA